VKTALVTGGGPGIGAAITDRLRADGYHVAVVDLNPSDTEFSYVADVTDRGHIDAALGPGTIVVNAAGRDSFRRFTDISFEDWKKIVDINLHGVFHTTQAVLPEMIEAGRVLRAGLRRSQVRRGVPVPAATSARSRRPSAGPPATGSARPRTSRLYHRPDPRRQ
jgi:2-hydroxycyclohexanecarboxyl-CoA dehydrogenase